MYKIVNLFILILLRPFTLYCLVGKISTAFTNIIDTNDSGNDNDNKKDNDDNSKDNTRRELGSGD